MRVKARASGRRCRAFDSFVPALSTVRCCIAPALSRVGLVCTMVSFTRNFWLIAAGDSRLYTISLPFSHLLGERALCAIGIILHAKVFVNLEQALLVRDGSHKLRAAWIVAEKAGDRGFQSAIR